jgi:MFS family permease
MPEQTTPSAVSPPKSPPRSRISGLFYGWWIVAASTVILVISSGIGFYCIGVFLDPLRMQHGWSKATISSAISLYFFSTGLIGMLIGRFIDIHGPKLLLVLGSIIYCLGLVLLSRIQATWQLYIIYFILAIGFSSTSLIPINALITKWFIRKRGFAMSLANTGLSVGGIILVPFATYLISSWNIQVALPSLGAVYIIGIVPMALFFVKRRPSDVNQYPDGAPLGGADPKAPSSFIYQDAQMRTWNRQQAAQTVAFWSIVVAFMFALGGQIAFLVHQVSFISHYLGFSGAAKVVSVTAAASIFGRLLLGTFVDRCDKRHVAMVCFIIQGLAITTLAYNQHVVTLYLCTFAFGLTMGSIIMMQSLITGECFGLVSFATVSGMSGVFTMFGAAFGPFLAGTIFDATQSYRIAFAIFAILSFIATIVIYFAKPPRLYKK